MNQQQLKDKAINKYTQSLAGTKRYLDKKPNNVFMLNHYNKLLKKIEEVTNYKIK
jgi:hypothetical protein